LFEGARAVGVEYRQDGETKRVTAAREVILSAGSLQSPQLLQLSGIGPAALLQQFGIPVVRDLPGVGENLQDHLQLRLIFKCTKPITTNDDLASTWRSARIGLQWLLRRTGPLAVGINQGGLFTRALPESTRPDIQFHFATLSADLAGAKPHPFSGFTMSVCQLRPTSRGHVRIKSADPLAPPAMQPITSPPKRTGAARWKASSSRGDSRPPRQCNRMSWPSIGPAPRRRATPTCSISRANSALRSFIRPEPAGWDQGRKPWSMTACASTA